MLFATPFVMAAIILDRFGGEVLRLRPEAERARNDPMVADDVVNDDPSWRTSEESSD